jgi:hypothetical protein
VKTDCDFGDAKSDFMTYLDGFKNLKGNEYFIRHQKLAIKLNFCTELKRFLCLISFSAIYI